MSFVPAVACLHDGLFPQLLLRLHLFSLLYLRLYRYPGLLVAFHVSQLIQSIPRNWFDATSEASRAALTLALILLLGMMPLLHLCLRGKVLLLPLAISVGVVVLLLQPLIFSPSCSCS